MKHCGICGSIMTESVEQCDYCGHVMESEEDDAYDLAAAGCDCP